MRASLGSPATSGVIATFLYPVKIVARVALGEATLPVTIDAGNLPGYIGRPRHTPESAERTALP